VQQSIYASLASFIFSYTTNVTTAAGCMHRKAHWLILALRKNSVLVRCHWSSANPPSYPETISLLAGRAWKGERYA